MIVYLCGPITGCSDEECKAWRQFAKNELVPIKVLDPMRRDYRGEELAHIREIVEEDKLDIERSDVLLVNYAGPSAGTLMEIIYGWEKGKRIVLVADPEVELSPWVIYHSHQRFFSIQQATNYLRELYLCSTSQSRFNLLGCF